MSGISLGPASSTFGPQLRALRERSLLSQEELAERAGMSPRAIRYLEAGRVHPRASSTRLLVDALGLTGEEQRVFEGAAAQRVRQARAIDAGGPAELPADVRDFLGRESELAALDDIITRGIGLDGGSAIVVANLTGTAGVGKTALAVHWAHQMASSFPDGQLFIDLRGYSVDGPVPPEDALARLLRSLGVPAAAVPFDVDERAALFRTTIADRQMVVVLDNAGSVDQVRPLLPGTATSAVVVTSRDTLTGLRARDGARRLELGQLAAPDARRLLTRLVGDRAIADPAAVAELADQCERLPLALRVAAELVAEHETSSLPDLVGELADQGRRLEMLAVGGDAQTSVETVLSWSYRRLSPHAARTFRSLGLHPGPDVDTGALAALIDETPRTAAAALLELSRGHLVSERAPGRYWLHDLLSAYARRLVLEEDDGPARASASRRLGAHYLAVAASAMDILLPASRRLRPPVPALPPSAPVLGDETAASRWLDAERPVLTHASLVVPADVSIALSQVLSRYLYDGSHNVEALALHRRAMDAAQATGDAVGEAAALRGLATVSWRWGRLAEAADLAERAAKTARDADSPLIEALAVGDKGGINGQQARYAEAKTAFDHALTLYRRHDVRYGEASTLLNLGVVDERRGHLESAAEHYREASRIFEDLGHEQGQAGALSNLAEVARQRGEDTAEADYSRAAELFRRGRNPVQEARALDGLGAEYLRQGRVAEAVEVRRNALDLFHDAGNRIGEGWASDGLADCMIAQSRFGDALDGYGRAHAIFRETGDATGVISSLCGTGDALVGLGRPGEAAERYDDARVRATTTGDRSEEARALAGLGRAAALSGDTAVATRHLSAAHRIFADLGLAQADAVLADLSGMPDEHRGS